MRPDVEMRRTGKFVVSSVNVGILQAGEQLLAEVAG